MAGVNYSFLSRSSRLACALSLALALGAGVARADNWQARFYEDSAPARVVGVDKKRHAFNYFERQSPFKLRYSYPCVTGQAPGDKLKLNDLRTPEGVYFIEYKIAGGLDFKEYGGVAYTLNYPNPVDRLRGKTGYGIWIHSKGFELSPTKGCVAIGLKDIAEVGRYLTPGTPVVLAEELRETLPADNGDLSAVRQKMREWSGAWMSRSPKLFDFYDPEAYTRATENFDSFRLNKERLFKILSFINIYNREIYALEGPGYWVTWAEQLYSASNLSTEGIRRLYWQKDPAGVFKIVGMEWIPRDVGMRADFKKGKLVAEAPTVAATDAIAAVEVPRAPRIDMPEQSETKPALPPVLADVGGEKKEVVETPPAPVAENTVGEAWDIAESITALAGKLVGLSDPLVPRKQAPPSAPDEIVWGEGRKLADPDKNESAPRSPEINLSRPAPTARVGEQAPELPPAPRVDTPAARPEPQTATVKDAPAEPARAVESATAAKAGEDSEREVLTALNAWEKAYDARDEAILDFYDGKNFNRLSEIPRGQSYNSVLKTVRGDLASPWLNVLARDAKINQNGAITRSESELLLVGPSGPRQGVQRLWWRKDDDGKYKIVASEFRQSQSGVEADYLEKVSGEISGMLEAWRDAWEKGRVDDYMSFYAPDATQQGRVGAKNIRWQKESLWARVKPASVRLSGLRLLMDKKGIRADMTQNYADGAGRSDKGVKTLLLRYDGKKWLIAREDWTSLEPAPARPQAAPAAVSAPVKAAPASSTKAPRPVQPKAPAPATR